MDIRAWLKSDAEFGTAEALTAPTSVLRGVSEAMADSLATLGIVTVFDLASSSLFEHAGALVGAAGFEQHPAASSGLVPGEFLDGTVAVTREQVGSTSIDALRPVSDAVAEAFAREAGIETIEDLGWWAPFHAARTILLDQLQVTLSTADPDSPSDLVPGSGDYAVEKHFYSANVFQRFMRDPGPTTDLLLNHLRRLAGDDEMEIFEFEGARSAELPENALSRIRNRLRDIPFFGDEEEPTRDLVTAGQLDLNASLAERERGFTVPAMGARIVYEQAWYRQGVALGQLLHSLTLAPGEMTRVAIIDWTRATSAELAESANEAEQLSNTLTHARALSEVTSSVATDVQSGFSATQGSSSTKSGGLSGGFTIGGFGLGGSTSSSRTNSQASSVAVTAGTRTAAADLQQNISDSTQQAASSERARRASVVQETEQRESERVETRIVANYNHSHALSMHYYEVLQIYRSVTRVSAIERLLFVPVAPIDLTDAEVIWRYRPQLLAAAVNPRHRDLLLALDGRLTMRRVAADAAEPASDAWRTQWQSMPAEPSQEEAERLVEARAEMERQRAARARVASSEASALSAIGIDGNGFDGRWRLPVTARLVGVRFTSRDAEINEVLLRDVDGNEVVADLFSIAGRGRVAGWDRPRPLAEVESISAEFGAVPEGGVHVEIEVELPDGDGVGQRRAVLRLHLAPVNGRTELVAISAPPTAGELVEALASDRLYYSQQIWAGLPAHEIAMVLGGYSVAGEPLLEQVDPVPQGSYGNYLLFRWLNEDSEWESWKSAQLEAARPTTQLVPIPTGGVFGEAILGRFNASEKLDISRFWNWQDSPIPHAAPEIAPVATGSRATAPGLTSPQFGAPIVNLMSPGAMPAPGTAGQLAASVAQGFRDMSGLDQTAGLAGALSNNATQASMAAGQQATNALDIMAQLEAAKVQAASNVAAAYLGGGGGAAAAWKGVGSDNPSYTGAVVNHAADLDRREGTGGGTPTAGPGGGDSGGATNSGSAGTGSGGSGTGGGAGGQGGGGRSAERSALDHSISQGGAIMSGLGISAVPLDVVAAANMTAGSMNDLDATADYLGITLDDLNAVGDRYFRRLSELLWQAGIMETGELVNAMTFGAAVRAFQDQTPGLTTDGVLGAETLWALNEPWARANELGLEEVDVDRWAPPGETWSTNFSLATQSPRGDIADDFRGLMSDLHFAQAVMTSAGSSRALGAAVGAGRVSGSFHLANLAFDLALPSGMRAAGTGTVADDAFLVTEGEDGRWQVWAQADGGAERTLDALWWDGGTVQTEQITTRVIDFTGHAAMRGFVPISPRNCWPGDYRCGEWWHFQHEGDTVPYISQLGAERIRARGGDFVDREIAGAAARWDEIKMLIRGMSRSWSD